MVDVNQHQHLPDLYRQRLTSTRKAMLFQLLLEYGKSLMESNGVVFVLEKVVLKNHNEEVTALVI